MAAIAKKYLDRTQLVGTYDFAVHGGAISTIDLGIGLPKGCVAIDGFMHVITAPAGSGASIAVQLEGANDVISAAAISGAPWSTTGLKDIAPVTSAATMILTTAQRNLKVVITGAALTAGKFAIQLRYMQAPNQVS